MLSLREIILSPPQPDAAAESGRLFAGGYKYNALRFRGKEDVLVVILICSHLKTVELHFRVAIGLFNELIAVDLDTDFFQMEIRQCDGIAVIPGSHPFASSPAYRHRRGQCLQGSFCQGRRGRSVNL